jgi:predicted nucleotidyltransferase
MTDALKQAVPAKYAEYLPGIRRRWRAEQAGWGKRRAAALHVARQAAKLLYERFSVKRVIAFGSVAREGRFDERSDIDLEVEGLARADYLRAWSAIDTHPEFDIDLVDIADCPPSLQDRILDVGMTL